MAKKRKARASEPESSSIKAPEIQQPEQQAPPPQEPEQPPIDPQQDEQQIEEQTHEELTEQQQVPEQEEEGEEAEEEVVEEEPQDDMDEDQKHNEEEQKQVKEEEGNDGETVDNSNDVAASAKQASSLEANGGNGQEDAVEAEEEEEEEEELELEEEPVEKLLEPFSKEQLVLLVKEAVSKFPEFIESVQKIADADPAHRKIFVHGLGWDTNAETLTSVYRKYGDIEDCKAVVDKVSGKSKGYGFILFKHRSGAQKALKQPQKKIGSRMTSCQLASAGPVPAPPPLAPPVSEYTQRKIFVSNVSADLDPQKLLEFFAKFGEIEDGPLGLDKQTGKPKGFALFVYRTVEGARKALEEPYKTFEGHTLHCQKAIDGPKANKPYYQHHHQQPHQQQQQHQHQQYHHHSSKKVKYSSGGGAGSGHLMAPSGPGVGFNPAVPSTGLNPALGQALTALLASQGAGLGITNLLGGLGAPVNQGVPPVMNNAGYGNSAGYGNQGGGGYGSQPGMQGGYQNPQMGQGSGRPQQGGAHYMGHGH